MKFNTVLYSLISILKGFFDIFEEIVIESHPNLGIILQLSLRDSNRLDEVRCSLTFDRSRFLNSPGLFTQMHIILHESVPSGHILLNKIFRFSLIFQTRLQKVDKIFRVL